MKINILGICIGFLMLCIDVYSQDKIKFGDVSVNDLKTTSYAPDPDASAVVLYESKELTFDMHNSGLKLVTRYHVRIKILTDDGLEYANAAIGRYIGISNMESDILDGLTGFTYNLEEGKVQKIKLAKEHIFEEKVTDWHIRTKFAFQSVKPGSIIEYRYQMLSGRYYDIEDHYFQRSIPVEYAKYIVSVPEYFRFSKETKGFEPMKTSVEKTSLNWDFGNGDNHSFSGEKFTFIVQHLPTLKEEEYIWCLNDFLTRVTFELKGITIPGSVYKDFASTWTKVEEELNNHEFFGKQFRTRYFKKEELSTLVNPDISGVDSVRNIYYMVRSKVKSNNERTFMARTPKDALRKGIGTSGEINAILLSTLLDLGFDAYPIVMSLRPRGRLPITHPTLDKLNYFIVGVNVDGQTLCLDASSQYADINILPVAALVDNARCLRGPLSSWVNLSTINKSTETMLILANFKNNGVLAGKITESRDQQIGHIFRGIWGNEKNRREYIEKLESSHSMQISEFEIEGIENTNKAVVCVYHFEMPGIRTDAERIYFNPLIIPLLTKNPFKAETRKLPVEFPFPMTQSAIIKITLPEEYTVEELPKSSRISFGNENDLTVVYRIGYDKEENTVNVSLQYSQNRIIYLPEEYPSLRDFFSRFAAQNEVQVVLKKR